MNVLVRDNKLPLVKLWFLCLFTEVYNVFVLNKVNLVCREMILVSVILFQRCFTVLAAHAFALVSTLDVSLKALAVFLLALTVLAVAALEMLVFIDSILKSLNVVFERLDDGLFSFILDRKSTRLNSSHRT